LNGAAAVDRRRITRTLGAAAGGLLGVAFLPAAAAFADDYNIVPDPGSTEQVTGIYGTGFGFDGTNSAPPAVAGGIQGDQLFDYTDTTTGATGTFDGDESNVVDSFGDTNQEVLVIPCASDITCTDAPPVGSVFDTYTLGDSGYENIYSAVPSSGGDVISDTWVTPLGDYTIPVTLDAADVAVADAAGVPLGDGDDFVPGSASTVTAITGIAPVDVAIQGDQLFDVDNASNAPIGSFDADETTTSDIAGTNTEAVLVTKDLLGTDVPPVGSVFNTINLGGFENIYSDLASTTPGADTISDTVVTPLGDFTIPVTFDAAAAEVPVSVDLPDGDDIVADPNAPAEVLTGINGLPPADVSIQGDQLFDLDNAAGTVLGTFDADETTTLDMYGNTTQTLLVTSDVTGTSGTAVGEVPPVGSVIVTDTLGSGFENIYTDLASTTPGADVFSDTLVTPFGDLAIPVTSDLAAGLATDLLP
jgi:hypothetical protein